jgi:hypothetical protein
MTSQGFPTGRATQPVEINARVAQAIIAYANVVQARRACNEAGQHLIRCASACDAAWGCLDADELHEANMCVLAGKDLAA